MTIIRSYSRFLNFLRPACRAVRPSDLQVVQLVRTATDLLNSAPDATLAARLAAIRQQVNGGVKLTDRSVVVSTFALVVEAARRALGVSLYDTQIQAGIALAAGSIVEMQTGEGKTLTTLLPATLHALAGPGVHVATVNAYLAQRDFETLRPVFELLGISVGLAADGDDAAKKRAAYLCDVTFATGYELGFDFLRDQARERAENRGGLGQSVLDTLRGAADNHATATQRGHAFVIIDEVDSVLIDEAMTPLILSAPTSVAAPDGCAEQAALQFAERLEVDRDFLLDHNSRSLSLTEQGLRRIHQTSRDQQAGLQRPWAIYVDQALRAKYLFHRDEHYVVRAGEVLIVDEYTGRIFEERRWRDGLHQAVEAREGLAVTAERRSVARVSRQCYFRLYQGMCGMTGTARGNEREFWKCYGLPVVKVPLRLPCRREMLPTRYFATDDDKWQAIASEIADRHRCGRPVLVGTRTIENSKRLSAALTANQLPHQLLNGLQDDDESSLVAQAGQAACVTIATNMAGRGTDIKLSTEARRAGGLHVIGTERHDASRIDRQLAGRAARQGDPGSCRFFVSAEDAFIRQHGEAIARCIRQLSQSAPPLQPALDRSILRLQRHTEAENFAQRRSLLRHELWLRDVLDSMVS